MSCDSIQYQVCVRRKIAPALNLRAIEIDGEPWFVATDVCKVLKHSNTTMALKFLDEEDRAKHCLGGGATNIISEAGLYGLLLKSRVEAARPFKKWVTSVVLPAIRRNATGQNLARYGSQTNSVRPDRSCL